MKILKSAIIASATALATYNLYQEGATPFWLWLALFGAFILGMVLGEAWEEFVIGMGWAENQKRGLTRRG